MTWQKSQTKKHNEIKLEKIRANWKDLHSLTITVFIALTYGDILQRTQCSTSNFLEKSSLAKQYIVTIFYNSVQ